MSTGAAPVRAPRRRPDAPEPSTRPPLALVPRVRQRARLLPFVVVVGVLLAGGLLALLLLNTLLAQASFQVHDLEKQSQRLTDQEQALEQAVAQQQTPDALARAAAALGMVPGTSLAFLRPDGTVIGVPSHATPLPSPSASPGAAGQGGASAAATAATPGPSAKPATASATTSKAGTASATTSKPGTASATTTKPGAATATTTKPGTAGAVTARPRAAKPGTATRHATTRQPTAAGGAHR